MKKLLLSLLLMLAASSSLYAYTVNDIPDGYFSKHSDMCKTATHTCANNRTDVRYLQVLLNADDRLSVSLTEDGYWGNNTKNAVKAFQSEYGLSPVDGWVGSESKTKLDEVLQRLKGSNSAVPPKPPHVYASDASYVGKIRVYNYDTSTATYYKIYRSTFTSKSSMSYVGRTSSTSYYDTDGSLKENTRYYYRVKACNDNGCSDLSDQGDWGSLKQDASCTPDLLIDYDSFDAIPMSGNTLRAGEKFRVKTNVQNYRSSEANCKSNTYKLVYSVNDKVFNTSSSYSPIEPDEFGGIKYSSYTTVDLAGDYLVKACIQTSKNLRQGSYLCKEKKYKFQASNKIDNPQPYAYAVYVDHNLKGQYQDIEIIAKNNGGYADKGEIVVSFPAYATNIPKEILPLQDNENIKIIPVGTYIKDKNGRSLESRYLMIKYSISNWAKNQEKRLKFKIFLDRSGNHFHMNFRATLHDPKMNEYINYPLSTEDWNEQQKWAVKQETIIIADSEQPRPKQPLRDTKSMELGDSIYEPRLILDKYKAEVFLSNTIYDENRWTENDNIPLFYSKNNFADLVNYNTKDTGFVGGLYRLNNGNYVLAFGGTTAKEQQYYNEILNQIENLKDIISDYNLVNYFSKFFNTQPKDAYNYFLELDNEYHFNKSNLTITGHSLGGALAQYVSYKTGYTAVTINTAPFPVVELSIKDWYNATNSNNKIHNIMANDDPLTFLDSQNILGTPHKIKSSTGHSIADFINKVYKHKNSTNIDNDIIDKVNYGKDGDPLVTPHLKDVKYTTYLSKQVGVKKMSHIVEKQPFTLRKRLSKSSEVDSLTPTLIFSDYVVNNDQHTATWFDVRKDSDRKFLYDSGWMKGDVTQAQVPEGYLEYNTKYRVRIVYKNNHGKLSKIGYGYFTTPKSMPPKIVSSNSEYIEQNSAVVKTIVNKYSVDNSKGYLKWGTNSNVKYKSAVATLKNKENVYFVYFHNLACGTTYYYKSIIENDKGSDEGELKSFTTKSCGAKVEMSASEGLSSVEDYDNVSVGSCETRTISITKQNDLGTASGTVELIGSDAGVFSLQSNASFSLTDKQDRAEFEVEFCPTEEKVYAGMLKATSTGTAFTSNRDSIVLIGEGKDGGALSGDNDFYLSNATVDKTTVKAGESLHVSVEQRYDGDSAEELKVYVGYYLSKDRYWDEEDKRLNRDTSYLSKSNNEEDEDDPLAIRPDTEAGDYYILFVADYKKQYDETDEDNNVEYKHIYVQASTPDTEDDFSISNLRLSKETMEPNDIFDINLQVNYSGSSTSTLSPKVRIYLSSDAIIDVSDTILFTISSSVALSSTQRTYAYSDKLRIPENIDLGNYYLLAEVDCDRSYVETNENNNMEYKQVVIGSQGVDTDGDGISDADEREAGTSPTDSTDHPAITLAIHAIPDMHVATNAEISPIDITIDTNLIGTASIKSSSSDIDIVVADDGNPLELTTVEDATGRATVTVTATIGTHSDQEQFVVTVGETKFYMQNSENEWEEFVSVWTNDDWIGKHDDQSFDYNRTENGMTTKIHSSFVGTVGRAYNDGRKSITLPTAREISFDINAYGGLETHIEGAVSPSGELPLGTHIDASPGEIEFIIPMTDRVTF